MRWLRGLWARALISSIRAFSGSRLVPIGWLLRVRRVAVGPDIPLPLRLAGDADDLHDATLAKALQGRELGTWSLGPRSLEFLFRTVLARRPRTVLEFGSGASTVMLGIAASRLRSRGHDARVLSVEQDAVHAAKTRELLADAGVGEFTTVFVCPLGDQVIEGTQTRCYVISNQLIDAMRGSKADFVLVDGPSGGSGVRFGTLPSVKNLVGPGAIFFLDDAMRDGELEIAARWALLPYVRILGIRLIEKGLLVGTVVDGSGPD